ncbi:MAG TPA: hypothetical protein DG048_10715 [Pseudoalteromonas sp.]|nr:hypothetical protein [Pseudoalteromonas sp.]|tara:strand:- start:1017 stop:2822 length:1806 start_codon:yes stop_codon:yes gene_type:complete
MTNFTSVAANILLTLICTFCILNSSFAQEEVTTIEQRRNRLMEWSDATYKASDHRLMKVYWILGDTEVNGCKAEYSNYMVDFTNHSGDNGKSIDNFALPPIVRYVYQFGHCLSEQNIEVLRNFVAEGPCCNNNEYLGHGTLNHAILQASSWYLLAQYFTDDIWFRKNRGQYQSQEVKDIIFNNLQNRFNRHSEYGHFELASPNYIEVNFFPLLNLIDFSEDSELKALAEKAASKTLSYLINNSFKGKLIPPLTRQMSNELNGSIENYKEYSYWTGRDKRLYWYYFGPELKLTLPDFRSTRSPAFWMIYMLSDWFPQNIDSNASYSIDDDIVTDEIPAFSEWGEDEGFVIQSQKYIGQNYALASSNVRYKPYWYSGEMVEFGILIDSDNIFNQVDCTQPYWFSNYTVDIENDFKIRWYDRSSPFMQTHLIDKHNMLFIADIPEKDPFTEYETQFTKTRSSHLNQLNQFVRCRIPKGFDVINKGELVIQVQEGKTYIQIESLSQPFRYESDGYYQYFILEGGKSAMHFYVTDKVSSMSELSNQASQNSASYTPDNNQILFTAPEQSNQVKMTFNNVLYQDSDSDLAEREIMYESIPLIEEVSQ